MFQQFLKPVLISGFTLISSSLAFASLGNSSGGGGQAVVCQDGGGNVLSAELLDLYEAHSMGGRTITQYPAGQNFESIATEVGNTLNDADLNAFFFQIQDVGHGVKQLDLVQFNQAPMPNRYDPKFILEDAVFLPVGVGLQPIHDASTILLPEHCQIMQAANYRDGSDKVYIDGSIWNAFSEVSKAALLTHEMLYHSLRVSGEITSDHTRAAVGLAYSGYKITSIIDGIPANALYCFGTGADGEANYAFATYMTGPDKAALQFFLIDGQNILGKTIIELKKSESPFAVMKPGANIQLFGRRLDYPMDITAGINFSLNGLPRNRTQFSVGIDKSRDVTKSPYTKITCGKKYPRDDRQPQITSAK